VLKFNFSLTIFAYFLRNFLLKNTYFPHNIEGFGSFIFVKIFWLPYREPVLWIINWVKYSKREWRRGLKWTTISCGFLAKSCWLRNPSYWYWYFWLRISRLRWYVSAAAEPPWIIGWGGTGSKLVLPQEVKLEPIISFEEVYDRNRIIKVAICITQ